MPVLRLHRALCICVQTRGDRPIATVYYKDGLDSATERLTVNPGPASRDGSAVARSDREISEQ